MATILYKKNGDQIISERFDALSVTPALTVGWTPDKKSLESVKEDKKSKKSEKPDK